MQSILQYRRFGRHVERQYKQNTSKAEAIRIGHSNPSSPLTVATGHTPSSPKEHGDADDSILRDQHGTGHREKSGHSLIQPLLTDHSSPGIDSSSTNLQKSTTNQSPEFSKCESTIASEPAFGVAMAVAMTGIEVRDQIAKEAKPNLEKGGERKVFVVGYEGKEDIMNPHNWSLATRWIATLNIALIAWVVGFASSIDSAAVGPASAEFGVSEVTESLATGLFLIGFGVGALFAGPISETVGRNPVYIGTMTLYMIFVMASGLAPNIGAQLTFRFLAGLFGSTPLTCAGGSISDLWDPMERTFAFPIFANAAFMGPVFGPVIGGFISESPLVSWRWTEWITLILSGLVLVLVMLFQPETYYPTLMKWKAARLRQLTGDERYRAQIEIRETSFLQRLGTALYRPFLLSSREPIIILLALYLTVIYIILFTFLNGYAFIFTETYGINESITGLLFLGIGVGLCFAAALVPFLYSWAKRDLAQIREKGGSQLPPEFRLRYAMFGAPAIPISMFWMGWTAYPSISFWSPLAASVLFGYGILTVFISSYTYIIDSYESYAASALVSVTLIRYVAAGGMVEVAIPFYRNLGAHWTLSIMGFLSAMMVPVPYLFHAYGPKIRSWSKYAVV